MSNQNHHTYIIAFNHGYLLSKFKPDLMNQIASSNNQGIYFDGLLDGKSMFEKERAQSRIQSLENLRKSKTKDRGLER